MDQRILPPRDAGQQGEQPASPPTLSITKKKVITPPTLKEAPHMTNVREDLTTTPVAQPEATGVSVGSVQPLQPSVAVAAPQPQPSPVYPDSTGSSGGSYNSTNSLFDKPVKYRKSTMNLISFVLAMASLGYIILLIFTGSSEIFGSSTVKELSLGLLSLAGVATGFLSQYDKDEASPLGLLGLIVSTVILLFVIIFASYHIKLNMELNKLRKRYNSSSSSGSLFQ